MRTVTISGGRVELHADGLTVTHLPGGHVPARAQDTDEYRQRAHDLGYGDDTALMSREHELAHTMLAGWLGLPYSPTLQGVATGDTWPHWHLEEAAVLALQAYARALGVSIVDLAKESSCIP
jgi:hypothetical protein